MREKIFSFIVLALITTGTVSAETLEIVNSELNSLKLWVRPHETLEISNAQICLSSGADCVLFIDKGARVTASNSEFGEGLTIYHVDPFSDALEVENSDVGATIIEGVPKYASSLGLTPDFPPNTEAKELANSEFKSFNQTLRSGQAVEWANIDMCTSDGGAACTLTLEPGTRASFSNSTLGQRFSIAHTAPLASGLSFVNTDFPGEFRQVGAPARIERQIPEEEVVNKRVVEELKAKAVVAEETARGVSINLPDVYFDFDKSKLTREAAQNVAAIGKILSTVEGRTISIEGHTDAVGSNEYNNQLSNDRADAVKRALVESGVSSKKLHTVGFGKQRPISDNDTDLGRAKNRRVEVILENEGALRGRDSAAPLKRIATPAPVKRGRGAARSEDVEVDSKTEVHLDGQGIRLQAPGAGVTIDDDGIHIHAE